MHQIDIRKIALFLAGKLPPYYGESNIYRFSKKLKEFAPRQFTNEEMLFVQQQAKNNDEEVYYLILDDLWRSAKTSESKANIISLLRKLDVNDEIIDNIEGISQENRLVLTEYTDESDFTNNFLIPFFRKIGYKDVRYTHGKKEYGKDIVMREMDKFGNRKYIGVQAKLGNVSGKTAGDIDELIGQISDGFDMEIPDLDGKAKVRMSEFIIVTNGHFTENAVDKILQKLTVPSQFNNVKFLDRTKIENMIFQ